MKAPQGSLVPIRVPSHLLSVPLARLEALVSSGEIRSEPIKNGRTVEPFIDLDLAERLLGEAKT